VNDRKLGRSHAEIIIINCNSNVVEFTKRVSNFYEYDISQLRLVYFLFQFRFAACTGELQLKNELHVQV